MPEVSNNTNLPAHQRWTSTINDGYSTYNIYVI